LENIDDRLIKNMVQTLSEHSLNGVCIIDESGLVYINEGFATMFGYPREDIQDKQITLRELVIPEHYLIISEIIQKILRGEMVGNSIKVTGSHKNGSHVFLNLLLTSDIYLNQNIIVGSLVDITENVVTREHLN
jgi:PAS domain S-box-containing protein